MSLDTSVQNHLNETCEECQHSMGVHSDADCETCQECNIDKADRLFDAHRDAMAEAKDADI